MLGTKSECSSKWTKEATRVKSKGEEGIILMVDGRDNIIIPYIDASSISVGSTSELAILICIMMLNNRKRGLRIVKQQRGHRNTSKINQEH